jgi:hypothetical protein
LGINGKTGVFTPVIGRKTPLFGAEKALFPKLAGAQFDLDMIESADEFRRLRTS